MDPTRAFDFTGRRILVVGASRGGIGSAVAHAFALCGAEVEITGAEAAPVESLQGAFAYHCLDVTDEAGVVGFAERFGALDVLVNCAGISQRGREFVLEHFRETVEVNLMGTLATCNAFADALAVSQGCVVNTASMYSSFASPANPGYGASKAAVAQLTRSLAVAWAPRGVRVNAVAPGFVRTEQSARAQADRTHYEAVLRRTPQGRWADPEDIAGPVLFLASPAASFVTGTVVVADGGYSAV